jgi:NADH:ubiquinone reductase (H+-translocating)
VVIVGAVFAGLEAARVLSRAAVDIVLRDKKNHHCFQPLLYQVATAALSPADVAWPIRSIVSGQENVSVIMADVCAIDKKSQIVTNKGRRSLSLRLSGDRDRSVQLVLQPSRMGGICTGFEDDRGRNPNPRENPHGFERAEKSTSEAEIRKFMTFVVVGAGPTGVELAGSIAEIAHSVLVRDFRKINPQSARVVLAEAGPRVLPSFPADLSDYTERILSDIGVEVLTGLAVTGCDDQGVSLRRADRICLRAVGSRREGVTRRGMAGHRR